MATLLVAPMVLAALFGLDSIGDETTLRIPVIDAEGELQPDDEVEGVVTRDDDGSVRLGWRRR